MNIARVAAGDITGWDGLAPHCAVDDLLGTLAPVSSVSRELGTREGKPFQVVVIHRPLRPRLIQLWIPNGEEYVRVVEFGDLFVRNLQQTLMVWGPPEWVLEEKRFAGEAIVTERVYASRGITLSVAEFTDPAAPRLDVLNVQLYRTGPVESYLADVGATGLLESQARGVISAFERVLAGEFLEWKGLSGIETVETLSKAMQPLTKVHAPAVKERMNHRFSVFAFDRGAQPSPVELWVLDGQNFVSLVEYDDPPAIELERTLAAAGPPDLVLENRRYAPDASVKEYIYASRGLTLSVAEPYAGAALRRRRLTHAQLYRASSTGYYWRYIGPGDELHPVSVTPAHPATGAKDKHRVVS